MAKKHPGKPVRLSKNNYSPQRTSRAAADMTGAGFSLADAAKMAWIFFLALIAYYPALHGKLIWNDIGHITAPALQSLHGLWRIWFELGVTEQYYPLLHTAFWTEYLLWGDSLLYYHLANVFLHSLSACLVIMIVRRLRLPGAWLAGFIFALHPICVESVAWISEQKSTLSAVFCLGAVLAYLHFDETRRKSHYFLSLGLFILALLSKTVTATLPAALLAVLWWRHGRLNLKRDFTPLLPWLGLGAFAGLFTVWVEKTYIGVQGLDFSLSFLQRCLLAGRILWFYLAKLAWPSNLTFIYPRWTIDAGEWWQYLYPAGFLALLAGVWILGKKRRGLFAALLCFVGTLFPVLGFFNVFPFLYSYVADRFQYLASLGVIISAAAGLAIAAGKLPADGLLKKRKNLIETIVCAALLLSLGVLTWRQSRMYADMETLWRTTVARNPSSSMAHNNLGELLFLKERVDEAMPHFQKALALNPGNAEANASLGNVLRYKQRPEEAIVHYKKALQLDPNNASFHGSLANTLIEVGRIEEAVIHYEASLRISRSDPFLINNFAWIRATNPKESIRNGAEAIQLALQAVDLLGANNPTAMETLAAAYAEAGRFKEAIAAGEKAHALALEVNDAELATWHAQLLEIYRSKRPYHEDIQQ